ncbi:hypothetical protein CAPTEDRAFT_111686 [Capitella teleta]|uniref:BTB domain-containing protein n=1 Tax=Capitella teleta TaxID=283909 RepID=R7VLP9_CAPTE|nr:hypothetical protein CAPTEDRAFT_111686 [Capitella teleta]|eukprot:ELU17790.1 hypothetical protein CAPTEDRAFT_111686 [Capitella teleta]
MDTTTSYREDLMTSLQRLRKNHQMTDIDLKLPDRSTISCHKLVLMAASRFFETMFQSGMKESKQREVRVDFSDAVTIKMIVDYFYSGEIDINVENVQDLVAASEFLCLVDLKRHLGAFMMDQIDAINCIDFYRYARKFSLDKLIKHSLEYIRSNFGQAFRSSDAFIRLTQDELINVISDYRLEAESEDMVFHCVIRWVSADPKKRTDAFVKIASFVRFPFCTQELLDRLPREPLMMNSACLGILSEAMSVRLLGDDQSAYDPRYTGTQCIVRIQSTKCIFTQTPQWLDMHASSVMQSSVLCINCPVSGLFLSPSGIHWINEDGFHDKWLADSSKHSSFIWIPPNMTNYGLTFIQEKLFSFGGELNGVHCPIVQSLDQIESKWKPEPSMLQPCSNPYVVHFESKIYVLGGIDAYGASLFTQEFDPVWKTWQLKAEMPGVCSAGAAVSLNENIFVVGGTERVCFQFTPSTDTWAVLSRPIYAHNETAAATVWKGHILLCGKYHGEDYNPKTDAWSACDALIQGNGYDPPSRMMLCTTFK